MRPLGGTMLQDVLQRMEKAGIIPIVVIEDSSKAVRLGRTVLDAGLDLIEITMRTPRAMEAVRALSKELPEMLVGAGTIFSVPVAREALSAGASFIVSPHLDEEIVSYCASRKIVCVPGAFTPSEVQRAIKAASRGRRLRSIKDLPLVVKVFPASTGGPGHITAMKAVFPDVRFLPLGGVNAGNLAEYLKAGAWAVGGTWICKKDLIEAGDFTRISELVKEAKDIVAAARK
jgi:2-dehydro-3-deoxyphosphogluconate aldolase/(4S)-4-hydroxy-2-oxoglutarate aldolase